MQELELFKDNVEKLALEIIARFVTFTGLPIPKSYNLPPIKFVQDEVIQKVGQKPPYFSIATGLKKLEKQLCDYRDMEAKVELLSYIKKLESFINTTNKGFDEAVFEEVDEEWLTLKGGLQKQAKSSGLARVVNNLQVFMEKLYEREYDFVICGDYSYNQQMIYFYETNIRNRLSQNSNATLIPAQQTLECMLAHEIFHSLHFMCLHDTCLAKHTTMLKLFNPDNITNATRKLIIKKRKTVIESLAKYFEYCYARDKGYEAYTNYEKHNFIGKRKHYPSWSYAGAKGLIYSNSDETFREALRLSIAIDQGRGFSDAYDVIDRVNIKVENNYRENLHM